MRLHDHLNQKRNGKAILKRLQWIEGQLSWIGEFNRKDLVARFAISTQQASADIALYKEFAPNNMQFDNSSKVFFLSESFVPLFDHEPIEWLQQEQHSEVGNLLGLVDIMGIPQKMDPKIFRTLNRCRKYETPVQVEIGTFSSSEKKTDLICPHSIVVTPVRWHVRAWSGELQRFIDLPISRILSAEPNDRKDWVPKDADREWLTEMSIILAPSEHLEVNQQEMVSSAYGMSNGIVKIPTKACLVYYTLAAMELLSSVREYKGEALDPQLNIRVLNYKELLPLVKNPPIFEWGNRLELSEEIQELVDQVEKSQCYITELPSLKYPLWLGSGFAKIAASYGAELCVTNGIMSTFMSVVDYKSSPLKSYFFPILLSFAGKGEDAVDTAENIANSSSEAGIITCNSDSDVVKKLSTIRYSYFFGQFPKRDNRFVNIKSILTLTRLVEEYACQQFYLTLPQLDLQRCAQHAEVIGMRAAERFIEHFSWQTKQLIIVGKGYNNPLEHVWKSILAEAGIMTPTWADIKDFTHGDHRHVSLYKKHAFLLLEQPEIKKYCDIFEPRFGQIYPVERINLNGGFREQFWTNLLTALFFTHRLTYEQGYNGNRPPKNEKVHSWRGWGRLSN
ncbi:hypothetical protein AB7W70_22495 [Providencia rettgeri]|nr:hypothetical protein [Providencia rettgeri]ELR5074566.1 hypothetical protein [Providencia stuartii]HEP0304987.1 hypothetical protein [Providencia rettgeri]